MKQANSTASKKDSATIFNTIYAALEKRTKLPQTMHYAGKNLDTDADNLPTRFELIHAEELGLIGQKSSSISQQKESQKFNAGTKEQNVNPVVKKVKAGLTKLDGSKNNLRDVLENNKEDVGDMGEFLDFMYLEVSNTYNNEVSPHLEELMGVGSDPVAEATVIQVFAEAEVVEQLNDDFSKYKKGKLPYTSLRSNALPLLKAQPRTPLVTETPGKPELNPRIEAVTPSSSDKVKTIPNANKEEQKEIGQTSQVNSNPLDKFKNSSTDKVPQLNMQKLDNPSFAGGQFLKKGPLEQVQEVNSSLSVTNYSVIAQSNAVNQEHDKKASTQSMKYEEPIEPIAQRFFAFELEDDIDSARFKPVKDIRAPIKQDKPVIDVSPNYKEHLPLSKPSTPIDTKDRVIKPEMAENQSPVNERVTKESLAKPSLEINARSQYKSGDLADDQSAPVGILKFQSPGKRADDFFTRKLMPKINTRTRTA